MNPFYALQSRMAAINRHSDNYAGFHSVAADLVPYFAAIRQHIPLSKGEGVLLDVGCGRADLWLTPSPLLDDFARIVAMDVQRYANWTSTNTPRPPNLTLLQAWPAVLPQDDATKTVALVKGVFKFITSTDARRMFWSLPRGVDTVIITEQSASIQSLDSSDWFWRHLRRLTVVPWEDTRGVVWHSSVVPMFQDQWAAIAREQQRQDLHEACPQCERGNRLAFDYFQENDDGLVICLHCGYETFFKKARSLVNVPVLWNASRIADYKNQEFR